MDDYINRQAAIDAIQKLVDKYVDRLDINRVPSMMAVQFGKAEDAKWSAAANSAEKSLNIVKAIPSEDVEPVRHGYWIDAEIPLESGGSMPIQACSLCKTFYPLAYTGGGHRFCPNCGARMDGEQDEQP